MLADLWDKFGLAGPMAVVAAVLPAICGFVLIGLMPTVAAYLRSHEDTGPYIYAVAFAVLAALAMLPTYAQSALGGFAFGLSIGMPAALFGFAAGAAMGYEIARLASSERVMRTIESKPQWKAVREAFLRGQSGGFFKTLGIVILLRLPPNSPFALMNLLMASVRVPRLPHFLGTVIGLTPRTAAAVWIGAEAARQSSESPEFKKPLWLVIGGVVLMLLALGVVGAIANRAIKKFAAAHPAAPPERVDPPG
jgi:uncharacterized membrane protein YdjX (TVP38/TMEM64 family)